MRALLVTPALLLATFAAACISPSDDASVKRDDTTTVGARADSPFDFEQNAGQFPSTTAFVSRTPAGTIAAGEAGVLVVPADAAVGEAVWLRLDGARWSRPSASGERVTRSHYFLGARSATDVHHYGELRYASVYPGVDLVLVPGSGGLRYAFELAPGADAREVALRFEGLDGVAVPPPPMVARAEGVSSVASALALPPGIGIATHSLTSTYFGGSGADRIGGVATDPDGNVVIVGDTTSTLPALPGGFAGARSAHDVFVAKLSPDLRTLIAVTYFGGSGDDFGGRVVVDALGGIYVQGGTGSTDLPTTPGALVRTLSPSRGAQFLAKLSPRLDQLLYATYFGDPPSVAIAAIAVDRLRGELYLCGTARSESRGWFIPVSSLAAAQRGANLSDDAFIVRLNATATATLFETRFGGSGVDFCEGIALDGRGSVFIAGSTWVSDLPVRNAVQPTKGSQFGSDAFVMKMNDVGNAVAFATYFGGPSNDETHALAVDDAGRPIIVGETTSGFPVSNALQASPGGGTTDAFVARFAADGSSVDFSTFLGGAGSDSAWAVASDHQGRIHVAGTTSSTNFPTRFPVQGAARADFYTILNPNGQAIAMSSYIDGGDRPAITSRDDHAFITTTRNTAGDPVTATAFDPTYNGGSDGVVGLVAPISSASVPATIGFEATSYDVAEVNLSVTVAVTRTGSTLFAANVDLTTTPGTATELVDYTPVATTVHFNAGQSRATVTIPVTLDSLHEISETFFVRLSHASGGALRDPDTVPVRILDGVIQ